MDADFIIDNNLKIADDLLEWITRDEDLLNDERALSQLGKFREQNRKNLDVVEQLYREQVGELRFDDEDDLKEAYYGMMLSRQSKRETYYEDPLDSGRFSGFDQMEENWNSVTIRSARSILFDQKTVHISKRRPSEGSVSIIGSRWEPGFTVPKPFSMTLRDQIAPMENTYSKEFVRNMMIEKWREKTEEENLQNREFRANPVPPHTNMPIYENMLRKAEERRTYYRENSREILHEMVQPFNLTQAIKGEHSRRCKSMENLVEKRPPNFIARPAPVFESHTNITEQEERKKQLRKERAKELLAVSALPPNMQKHARSEVQRVLKEKRHRNRCHEHFNFRPEKLNKAVPKFKQLQQQFEREVEAAKLKNTTTIPQPFNITEHYPCHFDTHKKEIRRSRLGLRRTKSISSLHPPPTKTNVAAELRIVANRRQIMEWDKKYGPKKHERDALEEDIKERIRLRLQEHDLIVRRKVEEKKREIREMEEAQRSAVAAGRKEMEERIWKRETVLERQEDLVRKQSANFRYNEALQSLQNEPKRVFRPSGVAPAIFPMPQRILKPRIPQKDELTKSSRRTSKDAEEEEEYLQLEIEGLAMEVLKKESSKDEGKESSNEDKDSYTPPSSGTAKSSSSSSTSTGGSKKSQ